MVIIQDVKPRITESAYVEKPFDEAKAELEAKRYEVISLEEFARLRTELGKEHHISKWGSYTREGFLYVPQKGVFLVRNSPILANAKKATDCHRNGSEFYLTDEQVEQSLASSVQFKDANSIPTNRFAEDERTVFAFGESAGKYGEFLKEAKIAEMPVYLANVEKKSFARQAWLHRLDEGYGSELDGGNWGLHFNDAVRGVRHASADEGSASHPTFANLSNLQQQKADEEKSAPRNLYAPEKFFQACAKEGITIQGELESKIRANLK